MTIDEVINDCERLADQQEAIIKNIRNNLAGTPIKEYIDKCSECSAYSRQIAEWLKELKEAKRLLAEVDKQTIDIKYSFHVVKTQIEKHIFYIITSDILKGCVAQGDTINEALALFSECEKEWLKTAQKYDISIPQESQ